MPTTHTRDDTIVSRFSSLSGKPYANEAVSTPILVPFNRGLFLPGAYAMPVLNRASLESSQWQQV